MDAPVLYQVRADSEKYRQKAEQLLRDAEAQFEETSARYGKTTSQYCGQESKLEQARAIHRAITAINAGQRVMFSDEVTMRRWLQLSSNA